MMKRILRSDAFLSVAGWLAAAYIRLVYRTSRVIEEPHEIEASMAPDYPLIAAMWHGQFLMIPALVTRNFKVRCMVARHGDAEFVGRALARFGMGLIRGAGAGGRKKDRGGVYALRAALADAEGRGQRRDDRRGAARAGADRGLRYRDAGAAVGSADHSCRGRDQPFHDLQ